MSDTVPEGYMKDAKGHLVPLTVIKPVDLARDNLVTELVAAARQASEQLARFKGTALGEIEAFVELSAEQYGARFGGAKGNVSLLSYDGRYKVERQVGEHLVFDERLQIAKELIDECVREWSAGSDDKVRVLVEHAFQVDKAGKVSTSRVLGLRRLDIDDPKWSSAMQAISDSVQVSGSRTYVRVYERVGETDQWRAIPLDAAVL